MISKELKEKYFVEEVSQITNDMTGWKVLGMVESQQGTNFELKTTLEGWLEEFRIKYIRLSSNSGMILVDQDCPVLYILDPEDIKELVKECISEDSATINSFDFGKLVEDNPIYQTWTTTSSPNWVYTGGSISSADYYLTNTDSTDASSITAITADTNSSYLTDVISSCAVSATTFADSVIKAATC